MAEADCIPCCTHCGQRIELRINKTTGLPSKAERRYCSSRCTWAARDVRRGPTQRSGKKQTKRAQCMVCGTGFDSYQSTGAPDGWTQCCSDRCARVSRRMRDGSEAAKHRVVVTTRHGHCATCGRHMQYVCNATYCSEACRPTYYQWQPTITCCVTCGAGIDPAKWRRNCDACIAESQRKLRRVARSRRRARVRNIPHDAIDPIKVFERDKWMCQLCGKRTPKKLRGTIDASAPELDHIVPLALGGGHTWGNVQCACRGCNHTKGATAKGQLGLGLAA